MEDISMELCLPAVGQGALKETIHEEDEEGGRTGVGLGGQGYAMERDVGLKA